MESLSKFLCFILRHKPDVIGITLDKNGYANVDELIFKINKSKKYIINKDILLEIVRVDNKNRYSFNEDMTLIRANQGHSINVDVELEEKIPPKYLFHGTAVKYVSSIKELGIKPKSRLYVHLSMDKETALNVGKRHGIPFVFKINAYEMSRDGYKFYISKNGIFLTKYIPVKYIEEA